MTEWFWIGFYAGLGYMAVGIAMTVLIVACVLVWAIFRAACDYVGWWKWK